MDMQDIETATVPMRQFEVEDESGRRYRVTRYVWLVNTAAEGQTKLWRETGELFLTENGGCLGVLGPDRFEIEGTETVVTTCKWSRPSPP
jgi:hypothetical protein